MKHRNTLFFSAASMAHTLNIAHSVIVPLSLSVRQRSRHGRTLAGAAKGFVLGSRSPPASIYLQTTVTCFSASALVT